MTDRNITLESQIAIVTGGAGGIGQATCELFTQHGAIVAILDIDQERGQALASKLQNQGHNCCFFQCDVANELEVMATIRAVDAAFGRIDILFNNAGAVRRACVVNTTAAEWDHVIGVNLRGVFLMSKYAIPIIARAGGGAVVNTGSGWGLVGGGDAASYCASKGAVVNLTRAMAIDHAKQGIRVNCICPGDTDTAMLTEEGRQLGLDPDEFYRESANRPLRRIGTPQEIAESVLFLVSPKSSYMTGSVLVVDGGGLAG